MLFGGKNLCFSPVEENNRISTDILSKSINELYVQLRYLMQIYSIPVGKRQGATKLEARGMFKGAKVTRGPDWEWKDQDNQPPMEGEVTEVTSWSDETNNDAVRVNWNKGPRGNIYRLGTNGKVTWANELLLYYYRHQYHHYSGLKKSPQPILHAISRFWSKLCCQNRSINPRKLIKIHFHSNKNIKEMAAALASVLDFESQSFASLEN